MKISEKSRFLPNNSTFRTSKAKADHTKVHFALFFMEMSHRLCRDDF